jgi:methylenetetrahydrofolate dehydrogenase (NADP+) / methenyltetrahydrofolate cyclohydrolase
LSSEPTLIIDGKAVAAAVREQVATDVASRVAAGEPKPGLATILIGDDPASHVYVTAKRKACAQAGIASFHHQLPAGTRRHTVLDLISQLNDDPSVSGILCQLPLPAHLDEQEITNHIDTFKDVDGLTIGNAGRLALGLSGLRPCTPAGVMLLLDHANVALQGKRAVVIGRSSLFGKPMGQLLLAADATPTTCHRHTEDLAAVCREADILVAAVGQAEMVRGDWIKPGAVVIDVGINRSPDGLVGDVCFAEAVSVASAITPVPGGVGPITIACLLMNTLDACRAPATSFSTG